MKKNTKYEFLIAINLKLDEIKKHLCDQRNFEGGVALGQLMRSIHEQTIGYTDEDEFDDEHEDDIEKNNYKLLFEDLINQYRDLKDLNKDFIQENNHLTLKLVELQILIKKLIDDGQIYPAVQADVEQALIKNKACNLKD